MGRLASIQAMRGVAAMLVVALHAREAIDRQGFILTPFASDTSVGSMANLGAAGVDLFFVISGFVMALSARRLAGLDDAVRFLALRIVRIAPLFWLLSLPMAIWWATRGARDMALNVLNTFTFVPLHVGPYAFPVHGVGWTLGFEFLFYAIVAALIVLRRLWLLAPLLFVLPLLPLQDHPWTTARWLTNPMLLEFGFGVVAFMLWRAGAPVRYRRAIAIGAACAAAALAVQHIAAPAAMLTPNGVTHDGLGAVRVWLVGLPASVLLLWALPRRPHAAAIALGEASYSLYLVHPLAMIAAGHLLPRSLPGDLAFILLIAASVISAFVIYRWIERPMTMRLRALVERPVPTVGSATSDRGACCGPAASRRSA